MVWTLNHQVSYQILKCLQIYLNRQYVLGKPNLIDDDIYELCIMLGILWEIPLLELDFVEIRSMIHDCLEYFCQINLTFTIIKGAHFEHLNRWTLRELANLICLRNFSIVDPQYRLFQLWWVKGISEHQELIIVVCKHSLKLDVSQSFIVFQLIEEGTPLLIVSCPIKMLYSKLFKALKVLQADIVDHTKGLEVVNPKSIEELGRLAQKLKRYGEFSLIQERAMGKLNLSKSLKYFTWGSQSVGL